jgi:hypothetical protein
MAKMMETLNVEVGEVSANAVILCSRAEDFNPAANVLWELDGNKSAVRQDVVCYGCKSAVAMSNHIYGRYTAMDKKPRVCCTRCAGSLLKTLK